ncbi:hypothetical protein CAC42_5925 [Sphaceloma murrayae]|uniref:Rhodopsin domain-containing protein n=1 Tax=Sphaceloma murrayae TaxID=2082308 RepID=A0A2K1QZK0_9PEZI|nr:hypothetical protein CAC42_5925 [Sphaceloma murrayae]
MSSPMALPAQAKDVESGLLFYFSTTISLTSVLLAVTTITVGLRAYVRAHIVKSFGLDDTAMLLAQVAWLATCVLTYICVSVEAHFVQTGILTMPITHLVQVIRFSNAAYSLTMILVKLSLAIFFLKLFATSFKWQRVLIIAMTIISTAVGIAYLIFTVASCGIMVQSQKTTPFQTGSEWCPIQEVFVRCSIAWSLLNAVTDLVFAALAVQVLWGAKMATATKISALVLILFGCVGGVASCVRVAVQLPLGDIRIAGILLGLWSNVEAGVCITAASVVTLRPLFMVVVEKGRSTFGSKGTEGSGVGSKGTSRSRGLWSKGHKSSDSASSTSSTKDVLEMVEMEEGREKMDVMVTRTWEVDGEGEGWPRGRSY